VQGSRTSEENDLAIKELVVFQQAAFVGFHQATEDEKGQREEKQALPRIK